MSAPTLVALLLVALFWGSAFPGIKLGLEGLDAGHLTLLRHLVASLGLFAMLVLTRGRLVPKLRDLPIFFLLGLLGIGVYHTALNFGELRVSAGAASLIIATAPAFTAVVAYLLLGERLSALGWLGILTAFAGAALIVLGASAEVRLNPYALLILVSAVVTALYAVLQKPVLKRYKPLELTAFATWAGTAPLFIFAPGLSSDIAAAPALSLWAALYIGLVPSAVAYTLQAYAISQAPVTLVAAFLYLVPVFSLFFSWLILGETPGSLTLLGGLVVLVGVILVNCSRGRAARFKVANASAD